MRRGEDVIPTASAPSMSAMPSEPDAAAEPGVAVEPGVAAEPPAPGDPASGRDVTRLRRADFDELERVSTRWSDNDMFGHLNNAVYYELFDSAINAWVIRDAGVDETTSSEIGVVAESGCRFVRELAYPEPVDVGIRVARLGRTSIVYELGLFAATQEQIAAFGRWVHVYIDRVSRATVPIPAPVRAMLESALARRDE